MKSRKKFLISLLADLSALTFTLALASCGGENTSGNLKFTELADGTWEVSLNLSLFSSPKDVKHIEIPTEYKGKAVTSIGENAFTGCGATEIEIPDSIITIGDGAFGECSNLTSVVIGSSVTSIGNYAFHGCCSLKSIEIPDSITSIGESAFDSSNQNVREYKGITYVGNEANKYLFLWKVKDKESLSYTMHKDVRIINKSAFQDCDSLSSIEIPDSVTTIGSSAFYDCNSLKSVVIPDSVTSIGDYAFYYCYNLTNVVIGDSVTSIGNYAFYYCYSLKSVVIPDSVTSIGDYAFYYCHNLTNVVIGDSVTSIGDNAFYWCDNLTSVTFKNPSGWTVGSISVTNEDLSDTYKAAEYLASTYSVYMWKRSEE